MLENIRGDLQRLNPEDRISLLTLVAGLLSQGFQAIVVYRFFSYLQQRGISGQPFRFVCERFIEITTGISIPARCRIGKGLRIHHFGGIIFHPTVEIGESCTLYQGVTIGDRGGTGNAAKIGNNVLIGAGAKIIGEISIGDNCIVGANAVVTRDMPADTVAIGSPCRFKPRSDQVSAHRKRAASQPPIPRVMDFRGTYKGGGGPDKTVLNSAARHDPEKVHVLVTYIKQPSDHEFQIPEMARKIGVRNFVDIPDGGLVDTECLKQLKSIILGNDLTIVHAHDDKTLFYAWLLKYMIPGLKIMYTCHSHAVYRRDEFVGVKEYLSFKIRQKIQIWLMQRYLKPIITVSHDTKKRLVINGLAESDVTVLHNGIDTDFWRSEGAQPVLREELGLAPGALLVGTVARITYDKDLPTFYRVAESVAKRNANVTFVIVGDGYGDELSKAHEDVARRGLEHVIRFTGHRDDLRNVYASFDIFLMTSLTEGMPNTLLEAMAMEVPAVSTAVGGVPELLVDEVNGFLAPVGDAEGLAASVMRLVNEPMLRARCGSLCRERVEEHFSFTGRVRSMEEYYNWFGGTGDMPVATSRG
jgi:serine acetyltransferase